MTFSRAFLSPSSLVPTVVPVVVIASPVVVPVRHAGQLMGEAKTELGQRAATSTVVGLRWSWRHGFAQHVLHEPRT